MNALVSLCALVGLVLLAYIGAGVVSLHMLFGIVLPYLALAVFTGGVVYRILKWAGTPVPFRIPTTCGQQKSLPWIKTSPLDNPSSTLGVIGRMALEVLLFRSLFRNTKAELREDQRVVYGSDKWLWLAGLAFHWSFLLVVIRHYRFFLEPVPALVGFAETLDSIFQVGLPVVYATDVVLVVSLTYLVARRLWISQVRYISLPADYFPLFLIFGIALSGICMRYFSKTDIVEIKALSAGLLTFQPAIPEAAGVVFYIHLFLVCVLLAYFPFSKLMHAGGVLLSPTRNLANNNRARRHVNPWDYPVKVHSYEAYEDEFREKMINAEIPVEKEA
jgi:[DsrC]-trisulfide reductase subunit M